MRLELPSRVIMTMRIMENSSVKANEKLVRYRTTTFAKVIMVRIPMMIPARFSSILRLTLVFGRLEAGSIGSHSMFFSCISCSACPPFPPALEERFNLPYHLKRGRP
jgi:hypothetical protein